MKNSFFLSNIRNVCFSKHLLKSGASEKKTKERTFVVSGKLVDRPETFNAVRKLLSIQLCITWDLK